MKNKDGFQIKHLKPGILLTIILSVVMFYGFAAPVSAFVLPDTGMTKCYTSTGAYAEIPCAGTGQDAEYSRNPRSQTDNGDGTITDNVTGQMWQKTATKIIWHSTEAYCKSQTLGGYTDWRVPSAREGIFFADKEMNWDTDDYFVTWTWHQAPVSTINGKAQAITSGEVLYGDMPVSYELPLHCVRGAADPGPAFVKNGDGTVTDNTTGLTWQAKSSMFDNWDEAMKACTGSWRLPNFNELMSLVAPIDDLHLNIDTNFFDDSANTYFKKQINSSTAYGGKYGAAIDGTTLTNIISTSNYNYSNATGGSDKGSAFCVTGGNIGTQNNCLSTAFLSSKATTVQIPVVTYNGVKYRLELKINSAGGLEIIAASVIVAKDYNPFSNCEASTLSDDFKLHIPALKYAGVTYNLDLEWNGTGFTVTSIK